METRRERGPAYDRLKQMIADSRRLSLKVGFPSAAYYEDGTSVAYVATIQELGSPEQGIPPRPFMRTTAAAKMGEWKNNMARGLKAIVNKGFTLQQVLDQVGLAAAGDIAKTIASITSPALKPATILARQRKYAKPGKTVGNLTKPLVATALMFNSVTHEVSDDSGQ